MCQTIINHHQPPLQPPSPQPQPPHQKQTKKQTFTPSMLDIVRFSVHSTDQILTMKFFELPIQPWTRALFCLILSLSLKASPYYLVTLPEPNYKTWIQNPDRFQLIPRKEQNSLAFCFLFISALALTNPALCSHLFQKGDNIKTIREQVSICPTLLIP